MSRKYTLGVVAGILLIAMGLVFLLDELGVAFAGALDGWYLTIIMYFACLSLAIALVYNLKIYYAFAFTLGGVFVSLSISKTLENITMSHTWPIILIFAFSGLLFANLASRLKLGYLKTSLVGLFFSILLLVGTVLQEKYLILSVIIMAVGVLAAGNCIYRISKGSQEKKSDVLYVTPSEIAQDKEEIEE